jgi:hypothetical protein
MSEKKTSNEELAKEAQQWDSREITPAGWEDAPEAVPRAKESVAISIRLPAKMVVILKEFARRADIGYQVLIKRWLDERLKQEHKLLKESLARERGVIHLASPTIYSRAAAFIAGQGIEIQPSNEEDKDTRAAV